MIKLYDTNIPSGIIWVQFDYVDVGEKTRHDNRHVYVNGIECTWTPIKSVTAAAKTIHRSQGDTETRIVVNFNTRRAIPHVHYIGLSRVTSIEGLYITDLCESKIVVDPEVKAEMQHLRKDRHLKLSIIPIYKTDPTAFKICFLNSRSLHRHIEDIQKDLNYSNMDVNAFSETQLC